jgi:hypothetical protein
VYYGRGWVSYNHWLGIQEKSKTKKTSVKSKKIKKFTIVKKSPTVQKINTDKNKKFIELSEKRMPKTIKAIKLIGNLSNTSNYFYSETDSKKINKELKKAIKILKKNYFKN